MTEQTRTSGSSHRHSGDRALSAAKLLVGPASAFCSQGNLDLITFVFFFFFCEPEFWGVKNLGLARG